ncbi:MAG: DUF177 domain-containing protein [Oscillospiraceae bacterium]|nr:DUF177 domain-containing protein [Oscillospiraceae bacterium]
MKIDMKPILNGETDSIEIDFDLIQPEEYAVQGIENPIKISGYIKNYDGYIKMVLSSSINYKVECARCLEGIGGKHELEFEKVIASAKTLQNEDNDDYLIIENDMIDIALPLSEQIVMEFPVKHLCRDDCMGLCPKCGKNLNENKCGCDLTEPDPRFDVLRQWLEK